MPKLLIVIASVREGRIGKPIADWFVERADEHGGWETEVADLKEIALPLHDEPHHPRLHNYTRDYTKAWSATVEAADAFVFVTPEYNYTAAPALLNAINYLSREWKYKTLGIVSYGGISAGTRSANQVRIPASGVGLYIVGPAVNIPFAGQIVREGKLDANEQTHRAVPLMLDEMLKVDRALRTLRADEG
jgi:NAD(P)H-dependent FMN reductase